MTVTLDDLKPYKSLIVLQKSTAYSGRSMINAILEDIKTIVERDGDSEHIVTVKRSTLVEPKTESVSIWTGFLHYIERRPPSWYAGGDDISNTTHELILMVQRNQHVGIYLSDVRQRNAVERLVGSGSGRGLGALERIHQDTLNAAFVTGDTRTVWLSGIHAPVSVKADSKVLSGQNLRDALDPLDDQTYHFTAARSSVEALRQLVGVSPRGSRIWLGASRDWRDFASTINSVLEHLAGTTTKSRQPLPVLAIPALGLPDIRELFEIHPVSPELLAGQADIDAESLAIVERWSYKSDFRVTVDDSEHVTAEVLLEGHPLASISVSVEQEEQRENRVSFADLEIRPVQGAADKDIEELRYIFKHPQWLRAWYMTGHTITDQMVFEVRHRDIPFEDFEWVVLSNSVDGLRAYDVTKEKFWDRAFPSDAHDQIEASDSLFSWIRNVWYLGTGEARSKGWLACDDGAMEIADFIHVDDSSDPPIVSLIHVKGAGSAKSTRQISVSAFEVVIGQAVKNLRFLDRVHLSDGLKAGLSRQIGRLVWHRGNVKTREDMIDKLGSIGQYRRQVIVLQPHLTKAQVIEVRNTPGHRDLGRMRHLDTLLNSAASACRDLGAKLLVIGEDI